MNTTARCQWLCLVLLTLGAAPAFANPYRGALPAGNSARGLALLSGPQSVAVPAYFYPAGGNLAFWRRLRTAGRSVRFIVATGLGLASSRPDASYQHQIRLCRRAGIRVLGYVTTSSGVRPLEDIEREIDRAYVWYGVDGIFFDEAVAYPVTCGQVPYYDALNRYAKKKRRRVLTVLNHGQILPECYSAVADILLTAEMEVDAYAGWHPWGWEARYPASRFWHLVYGVETVERMREVVRLGQERNAGIIFVTSGKMSSPGGPWGVLPSEDYWQQEMEAAKSRLPLRPMVLVRALD